MEDLRVSSVSVRSFRNHDQWSTELDPRLTILVGPNAAGKTNVLEAVMVTAAGTSFRSFSWGDLVSHGREEASTEIRALRAGTPTEISLRICTDGTREYSVNGRKRRRMSEVAGKIPLVAFVPEDLAMSKGAAEARRAPLDTLGDRLSTAYSSLRIEYARLVRQRNSLLRQQAPDGQIEPWDEMVSQVGAALTLHRARLLARIAEPARRSYRRVSGGEELSVAYRASWGQETAEPEKAALWDKEAVAGEIALALREARGKERERGSTLFGPHRDDVALWIDERPVRAYASQGQHRTVALAWKMAEVAVVHEVSGVRPLLLLDDVMSELDGSRRQELSAHALEGSQAIVTTTNLAYFPEETLSEASVVRIGNG